MKDFTFEYDDKTNTFNVEHKDVLKDLVKSFEKELEIKPFQVAVQISFEKGGSVAKPDPVKKAALKVAEEIKAQVLDEVEKLHARVVKLKAAEDGGNKKAATEAEKDVKATKKSLEKLAGEFGGKIRTAVENSLKDESGQKVKGRSASRTNVRGLELCDGYFKEKAEKDKDDAPPGLAKSAKTLAVAGKELASLTEEEKKLRAALAKETSRLQDAIDKDGKGKTDFDIREFAKSHPKEIGAVEAATGKYADFLDGMNDTVESANDASGDAKKMSDKSEALSDSKEFNKHLDAYHEALNRVKENLDDKIEIAQQVQKLLKDDSKFAVAWKSLTSELESMKGATNSGKTLATSGAALQKYLKS